ncbi:MAG: hypothetical protein A3F67_10980 [Verrucomicrobia bacterium RIFCSPHIGHO2_12_FULL_41_10]|nr:MAG: hypothetical protein A3F67_10980 [Verrucomicrobia bacterium RIFCSPHIGHO2_12_FULL_41_10]
MGASYRTADATVSAHNAVAITPSDSAILPVTRGVYVGVTGNLNVVMADGSSAVVFSNVPVGIFPIQVKQVYATSTTATSLVALY